jgi:sporadic carbohydrate cluster protein (TIGR04323 family)
MGTLTNRKGYRGYMSARQEMGRSVPQHIQQLVMRDYCKTRDMAFLLAAVEYQMPGCTLVLDAVLGELDHLEGIVMYSIALLPASREKRQALYQKLFEKGCTLHAAAESLVIRDWNDVLLVEDTWLVKEAIDAQTPELFTQLAQWDRNQFSGSLPEEDVA